MTTYVNFVPPPNASFHFLAELDGALYNAEVRWELFGQRWFITVVNPDGSPVFTLPLIGSPPDTELSLTAGYFTSTLVFREDAQRFEINP